MNEQNRSDDQDSKRSKAAREAAEEESPRPSIWTRLRSLLTNRAGSLREDLAVALEDTGPALPGSFSASERALLQNVLKLGEMRVDDVMVPRPDIEAIGADANFAELILRFRSAGHSRLPVYEDNLDNILGFVHIKDALQRLTAVQNARANGNGEANGNGSGAKTSDLPVKFQTQMLKRKVNTKDMVRKVLFVPPSMPVGDLLQQMQATRVHMAIVVDEYGGTDGLVTIEDLLEAVVGDIEDEHDEDDGPLVRALDENTYLADARAELEEVARLIGPDFDPGAHGDDVDTLGGLILEVIDRVPVRGEVISKIKGFEIEILAADARRIRGVRIVRRKRPVRARVAASSALSESGSETNHPPEAAE